MLRCSISLYNWKNWPALKWLVMEIIKIQPLETMTICMKIKSTHIQYLILVKYLTQNQKWPHDGAIRKIKRSSKSLGFILWRLGMVVQNLFHKEWQHCWMLPLKNFFFNNFSKSTTCSLSGTEAFYNDASNSSETLLSGPQWSSSQICTREL